MKWLKSSQPETDEDRKKISIEILYRLSIGLMLTGLVIVLLFGASASAKATILIWMLACLLSGTAIGFLFGIPKILQGGQGSAAAGSAAAGSAAAGSQPSAPATQTTHYQQQVNTNLTEISDWLTKIIVGLGLVNLTKIPPHLSALAKILATALDNCKDNAFCFSFAFAYATIITYTVLGFLFGYITTRLYLASAFSRADQEALSVIETKTNEAVAAAQSALQKAEFALPRPKPEQADAEANANADAIVNVPIATADEELDQLITEYNNIRATMSPGDPRTTRMTGVVRQMTDLSNSLKSFDVAAAMTANDDGKRLAAYAYLYARPDYARMTELVNALTAEKTPFGQYWAIQALGKLLALRPNDTIESAVYNKLQTYYNQLKEGVDRKFELGRILPSLKTK